VEELNRHPDFPSLLSISDVLKSWNVANIGYQVPILGIGEINCPFIAQLSSNKGEFVIVNRLQPEYVTVSNERWSKHRMEIDEFKKLYTGFILVPLLDEFTGESDEKVNRRKEYISGLRKPIQLIGTLIVLMLLYYLNSFALFSNGAIVVLFLTKGIGIGITILVLAKSLDINNSFLRRICKTGNRFDCASILSSKAAMITNEISWSEAGFFYFFGTFLLVLFSDVSSSLLQFIALLNFLCLPYSFYSIYYQIKRAKKWCLLCCIVQSLFWIEFLLSFVYLHEPFTSPGYIEWSILFICLALPVLIWSIIKPILLKLKQFETINLQLRRLKFNSDLFHKILSLGPKYSLPDEDDTIIFGNRSAKNIITIVSNPYCQPCSKAHAKFEEWIPKRDDIRFQIVFSYSGSTGDLILKVANHAMALYKTGNIELARLAIGDWYKEQIKDFTSWKERCKVDHNSDYFEKWKSQQKWCIDANVDVTPTIFLNGYRIPETWDASDIKYLV